MNAKGQFSITSVLLLICLFASVRSSDASSSQQPSSAPGAHTSTAAVQQTSAARVDSRSAPSAQASQPEQPQLLAQAPELSATAGLSASGRQLAEQLKLLTLLDELKKKNDEQARTASSGTLVEVIYLRQKIAMIIQHAAIEIEEAVAAIDGDLTLTNMLLAYVSSRRDRALLLNNVATFVGSGTFGLLDSSSGIRLGPPTPQVFGIIGNSIATGLPIFNLHQHKYENPRKTKTQANMLAPIFGRPYTGEAYDPVVWNYIESVPVDSPDNVSRRQRLLKNWRLYRNVGTAGGTGSQEDIDVIVGIPKKVDRITFDLLKIRAELLYDLRALVQMMYRDLSELSTIVMKLS